MILYETGESEADLPLCRNNSSGEELLSPILNRTTTNYFFVMELSTPSEVTRKMTIRGLREATTVGTELNYYYYEALERLKTIRSETGCALAYPSKSKQKTSPKEPPLSGDPRNPGERDIRSVIKTGEH